MNIEFSFTTDGPVRVSVTVTPAGAQAVPETVISDEVDPAAVLRTWGATIPDADRLARMSNDEIQSAARAAWRSAAAHGHNVSGAMLAAAFDRSDRWGRVQIAAAREES